MFELKYPPINELVLDVQFQPLQIPSADLADIRALFRDDYPIYSENLPLAEEIERYDAAHVFTFDLGPPMPPIRRQWYTNELNDKLFQFQPNRFIHNWRKLNLSNTEDESYPRFGSVFPEFSKYLSKLNSYVSDKVGKGLALTQWEITKFNFIIFSESEWWKDVSDIFTFCCDCSNYAITTETMGFSKQSLLLNGSQPIGRLYQQFNVIDYENGRKAATFKLSARGSVESGAIEQALGKIQDANELINGAFKDATTQRARDKWGQADAK